MREEVYIPFLSCGWRDNQDGTCSHPQNNTPECHQFCCPIKRNTKIVAIMDGGDWYDASVEHLVIPNDMNLEQQKDMYNDWYHNVFQPERKNYVSFIDRLKEHGARETTDNEVLEFWEV